MLPGISAPPPPPADLPLPPAPLPAPTPGGSIPKGGGKHKEKKKHLDTPVLVQVPLAGLSRPHKRGHGVSAESLLLQEDAQDDSDSDSDSDVHPRRHSKYRRISSQLDASDSDPEDSPGRHGRMSSLIEAQIQEALSGAGYMKESVFRQAMVECQQDQSHRMAALEQRASNAGEDSFMNFFQSNYYVNICIICNISEYFSDNIRLCRSVDFYVLVILLDSLLCS